MNSVRATRLILILSLILFLADRALKSLALHGRTFGDPMHGVGFQLLRNSDIALSISFPRVLSLSVIPLVCIAAVWYCLQQARSGHLVRASVLAMAVVGAASNYIDRLQHGYVVDYLHVGTWFPVFNLADVMITCALALVIIDVWRSPREE